MQSYKRTNTQSFPSPQVDDTTMALQTIGMRIRKSVNDGYMIPDSASSSLPATHLAPPETFTQEQQPALSSFQRVALPDHLRGGPPSLDYYGSTASSLGDWENELSNGQGMRLQTFQTTQVQPQFQSPSKRKRDDYEYDPVKIADFKSSNEQPNAELPLNTFVNKYGPLSFDEEF